MNCCLIATDEAGYGPQLGPLVIAATCWNVASVQLATTAMLPLNKGIAIEGAGKLRVSDSKQVFSPGKQGGLAALEIAMLATLACLPEHKVQSVADWIAALSPDALNDLQSLRWFASLDQPMPIDLRSTATSPVARQAMRDALSHQHASLTSVSAAILPARRFNQLCEAAGNKATLLSEQTIELVMPMIAKASAPDIEVFSDKHGGRAYYAGLLQHFFPDGNLLIEIEGRQTSRYLIRFSDRTVRWHFTAKGDRFTPVALASMIAKYTRERLMAAFNDYWQSKLPGLLPTAGYPGDAARFLTAIEALRQSEAIADADLIRCR